MLVEVIEFSPHGVSFFVLVVCHPDFRRIPIVINLKQQYAKKNNGRF